MMCELLSTLMILAADQGDSPSWMKLLFPLILVAFYALSSLLKSKPKPKPPTQQRPPARPTARPGSLPPYARRDQGQATRPAGQGGQSVSRSRTPQTAQQPTPRPTAQQGAGQQAQPPRPQQARPQQPVPQRPRPQQTRPAGQQPQPQQSQRPTPQQQPASVPTSRQQQPGVQYKAAKAAAKAAAQAKAQAVQQLRSTGQRATNVPKAKRVKSTSAEAAQLRHRQGSVAQSKDAATATGGRLGSVVSLPNELARAVVYSEILGSPLGLRPGGGGLPDRTE